MVRGKIIIVFPSGGSYRLARRRGRRGGRLSLILLLMLSRVLSVIENVEGRVVSVDRRRRVTLRVSWCTRLLLSPWGAWGGDGAKHGKFRRHGIRVIARFFIFFFTS
jgi:hypothetical protein